MVAGKATSTLAAQLSAIEARGHALCRDTSASRCFVQTDLAATYLVEGDHEHAAMLTRDVLSTAGEVSSGRTVSRFRALQQQIRPLRSVVLTKLDEEIKEFLRRTHNNEDITT